MERIFRSLKTEWIPGNGYANFSEASTAIMNYITGYYSQLRPHHYNGDQKGCSGKIPKPWPVFVDHYNTTLQRAWLMDVEAFISLARQRQNS